MKKSTFTLCNDCDNEFWSGAGLLGTMSKECPNGHLWCVRESIMDETDE